jgi:hypothetical protein
VKYLHLVVALVATVGISACVTTSPAPGDGGSTGGSTGSGQPGFGGATGQGSRNLNAFAERFVLSIKSECLDRIVPLGESHLRSAVAEYARHYHHERNHQGLGNALIDGNPQVAAGPGAVARRERLGGLLNFYHREAA